MSAMTSISEPVPEGYTRHFRTSPLTDPWEPLYSKRTDKGVTMGLRLDKPHTNSRGLIHGGLIASLADNSMGYSCAQAMGETAHGLCDVAVVERRPAGPGPSPERRAGGVSTLMETETPIRGLTPPARLSRAAAGNGS